MSAVNAFMRAGLRATIQAIAPSISSMRSGEAEESDVMGGSWRKREI